MCTIDGNGNCNDNMAIDEEGEQENPLCTFQSIGKLAADLLYGELRRRDRRKVEHQSIDDINGDMDDGDDGDHKGKTIMNKKSSPIYRHDSR